MNPLTKTNRTSYYADISADITTRN